MASPTRTLLPRWFCKAHATCLPTPDDHGNLLSRKAHWPRGSVQGQPRANMAVLMGSQLLVGWHMQLRIIARIAMTSQDGTVVKHGLVVRQCGGWWRAAREGRRVSSLMTIAASRSCQRTANASSPPVLTTANASSTYVLTRAGMPPQRMVRAAT